MFSRYSTPSTGDSECLIAKAANTKQMAGITAMYGRRDGGTYRSRVCMLLSTATTVPHAPATERITAVLFRDFGGIPESYSSTVICV
jgi:hypothetical protein